MRTYNGRPRRPRGGKWLFPLAAAGLVLLAAACYRTAASAAGESASPAPAETSAPAGDICASPSPSPQTAPSPSPSAQPDYDYTAPVPEGPAADVSYFDGALFIGNSLTEGFAENCGLDDVRAFAAPGVMVDSVFTSRTVPLGGEKVPILDAAARTDFSRVYVMLGMNELGWKSLDYFTKRYGAVVDALRASHPDAAIYVQSILPVTAERSGEDKVYNNDNVARFNAALRELCAEKRVYYVDAASALAGPDGALPAADAWDDGIHLKSGACRRWLAYLETHTAGD